jgi:hypothetical protein
MFEAESRVRKEELLARWPARGGSEASRRVG